MNRFSYILSTKKSSFFHSINREKHFKVVISGAGAGGLGLASRIHKKLPKGELAIIDPSEIHYYQPFFTCLGAGIIKYEDTFRKMQHLIPPNCKWIQDSVQKFMPKENKIITGKDEITYDYLVIALGIIPDYEKIKGLSDALDNDPRVCTNYSPTYVKKTFPAYENFAKNQSAIFTFPSSPVKCAGGAQKVMYLFEDYLRKNNKREGSKITYLTGTGKLFSVDHYSMKLTEIASSKGINVGLQQELVEIDHNKSEIVVQNLKDKTKKVEKYDFLHVTPPMKVPACLSTNKELCETFLMIDKHTLRHDNFENIFGIGDCTSLPTSKTAASASTQMGVVEKNLLKAINKTDQPSAKYDGYSSCPILTGYDSGIIAEFDYSLKPKESLPIDQSVERKLFSFIKKTCLPIMYWDLLLKGNWIGPAPIRKYLNFRKNRHSEN